MNVHEAYSFHHCTFVKLSFITHIITTYYLGYDIIFIICVCIYIIDDDDDDDDDDDLDDDDNDVLNYHHHECSRSL